MPEMTLQGDQRTKVLTKGTGPLLYDKLHVVPPRHWSADPVETKLIWTKQEVCVWIKEYRLCRCLFLV